jgi:hypothetical protein
LSGVDPQGDVMETSIGEDPVSADDLAALAAEAFIYGFPLVFDLKQVDRFSREGIGDLPSVRLQRVQPCRLAGRAGGHLRLDQQRHPLLDRQH